MENNAIFPQNGEQPNLIFPQYCLSYIPLSPIRSAAQKFGDWRSTEFIFYLLELFSTRKIAFHLAFWNDFLECVDDRRGTEIPFAGFPVYSTFRGRAHVDCVVFLMRVFCFFE